MTHAVYEMGQSGPDTAAAPGCALRGTAQRAVDGYAHMARHEAQIFARSLANGRGNARDKRHRPVEFITPRRERRAQGQAAAVLKVQRAHRILYVVKSLYSDVDIFCSIMRNNRI